MELLAPAGSYEQALVSIRSGCDALYGGLKKWSARNRAVNMTVEEYLLLMEECRRRSIRFYLTVNTLLTDAELAEVNAFFHDPQIIPPDGILAGDIGLIALLRREFSHIPIHASTQMGAYSLADVRYFQSLGIQRIVLARELTLEEIRYIRANTDAELEVFVYGNQCVAFSGNCLWGGLLHSGSGHRGRCIGACNDLFKAENGRCGNFFWANNIGLFGMVKELEAAGVDSIKIEGRVRPNEEVADVVRKFRRAMAGESLPNDYGYRGFAGGDLPPTGMFNDYNPENRSVSLPEVDFTCHDWMRDVSGGQPHFARGSETQSKEYVYTIFSRPLLTGAINIRLRPGFEDGDDGPVLRKVDYVNVNGERVIYNLPDPGLAGAAVRVEELCDLFRRGINANIYECMSRCPARTRVIYNPRALAAVMEQIDRDVAGTRARNRRCPSRCGAPARDSVVITDSTADIRRLTKEGWNTFVYVLRTRQGLVDCLALEAEVPGVRIIYRLPYLDFEGRMEELAPLLRGHRVMITRISQLDDCRRFGFEDIWGDYMLNVWNSIGAAWLKERGVRGIIGHPEITAAENAEIQRRSGLSIALIRAGKVPLGYTRACFSRLGLCSRRCADNVTTLHNELKGGDVQLVCGNEFGFRVLQNGDYWVSEEPDFALRKVYILAGLTPDQKVEVLGEDPADFETKNRLYMRWE